MRISDWSSDVCSSDLAQLAALRAFVLRYKDSPALLMWGIGNEVEAELTDNSQVWPAIEEAARLVKSLDPNHPTMAVIADTDPANNRRVKEQAPSINVLGSIGRAACRDRVWQYV